MKGKQESEGKELYGRIDLGHGAVFHKETNIITAGPDKFVTLYPLEAKFLVLVLTHPEGVDKFTLAQMTGLVHSDDVHQEERKLHKSDINKVEVTLSRLRKALRQISPELAEELNTEINVGVSWGKRKKKKK